MHYQDIKNKLIPLSESSIYILLSLYKNECHGYGIIIKTREMTSGKLELITATVYSAIQRFIKYGLVEFSREEGDKKYYRITEMGRRIVEEEYQRISQLKLDIENIVENVYSN